MATNINEAYQKIRQAGPSKVRSVPMPGQNVHSGQHQIEILLENGSWEVVADGMPLSTANDLISQAVNRVING